MKIFESTTKIILFFCVANRVQTYTKTLEEFYAIQLHHSHKFKFQMGNWK
jgi:hypothetical protein